MIKKLLAGETVTYDGEKVKVKNAYISYHPKEKVPLYLSARGPQMLKLAGEFADGVAIGPTTPMAWVNYAKKIMNKAAEKAGRNIRDMNISQELWLQATDEPEKMRDRAKDEMAYTMANTPNIVWEKMGIEIEKIEAIRKIIEKWGPKVGGDKAKDLVADDIMEEFVIMGKPQYCIDRLEEWFNAGITHAVLIHFSDTRKNVEFVGKEIIPRYKYG